jgi:hypothetical protein
MAYELEAIIAPTGIAASIAGQLDCGWVDLDGRLGLVPWIGHRASKPAATGPRPATPPPAEPEPAMVGPANVEPAEVDDFEYLDQRLRRLLAAESIRGPVAYVEAMFFGGRGGQAAAVFEGGATSWQVADQGRLSWPDSPISQALRRLGVRAERGKDAFDTVGLGRHRRTEQWVATARGQGVSRPESDER